MSRSAAAKGRVMIRRGELRSHRRAGMKDTRGVATSRFCRRPPGGDEGSAQSQGESFNHLAGIETSAADAPPIHTMRKCCFPTERRPRPREPERESGRAQSQSTPPGWPRREKSRRTSSASRPLARRIAISVHRLTTGALTLFVDQKHPDNQRDQAHRREIQLKRRQHRLQVFAARRWSPNGHIARQPAAANVRPPLGIPWGRLKESQSGEVPGLPKKFLSPTQIHRRDSLISLGQRLLRLEDKGWPQHARRVPASTARLPVFQQRPEPRIGRGRNGDCLGIAQPSFEIETAALCAAELKGKEIAPPSGDPPPRMWRIFSRHVGNGDQPLNQRRGSAHSGRGKDGRKNLIREIARDLQISPPAGSGQRRNENFPGLPG